MGKIVPYNFLRFSPAKQWAAVKTYRFNIGKKYMYVISFSMAFVRIIGLYMIRSVNIQNQLILWKSF